MKIVPPSSTTMMEEKIVKSLAKFEAFLLTSLYIEDSSDENSSDTSGY